MAHVKPLCCNKKTWQQGSTGGWMAEMTESERRYFYLHTGGNFNAPLSAPHPPLVSRPFCCVQEVQVGHAGKMACSSKQGFSPFSPISTSGLVLILNIHLTWTLNFNTNVSLSYFFPVYWLLAVLSPEDLMPTFLKLVMAHNPHVR